MINIVCILKGIFSILACTSEVTLGNSVSLVHIPPVYVKRWTIACIGIEGSVASSWSPYVFTKTSRIFSDEELP